MRGDEDRLAFLDESGSGRRVEIHVDPIFLFFQTCFCFSHVICDRVRCNESVALCPVIQLGGGDKASFELRFVQVNILLRGVALVQTKRN